MAVEYLGNGNDDGVNFGIVDAKIGFYGVTTPVAKQTLTNAVVAGSSLFMLQRGLCEINVALAALGLITTV